MSSIVSSLVLAVIVGAYLLTVYFLVLQRSDHHGRQLAIVAAGFLVFAGWALFDAGMFTSALSALSSFGAPDTALAATASDLSVSASAVGTTASVLAESATEAALSPIRLSFLDSAWIPAILLMVNLWVIVAKTEVGEKMRGIVTWMATD